MNLQAQLERIVEGPGTKADRARALFVLGCERTDVVELLDMAYSQARSIDLKLHESRGVDEETGIPLRILDRLEINEYGCWLWTGSLNEQGYGQVSYEGSMTHVHALLYKLLKGPVPEGKELDHFECQVRRCANPDHVEPVTHAENVRRGKAGQANKAKTTCPRGHEYSSSNTYVYSDGRRECKTCNRTQRREGYWKKMEDADGSSHADQSRLQKVRQDHERAGGESRPEGRTHLRGHSSVLQLSPTQTRILTQDGHRVIKVDTGDGRGVICRNCEQRLDFSLRWLGFVHASSASDPTEHEDRYAP